MKIKCLVLDDEPLAVKLLTNYIQNNDNLELVYAGVNVQDAISKLKEEKIDLVFIDIQMPEMSGLEFMEAFNDSNNFIVTTAYSNYAIESFGYHVVDYLLKPYSYARFCQAIDKFKVWFLRKEQSEEIVIKSNSKLIKLNKSDIKFVEGLKDYVKVYANEEVYIVYSTMKSMELELGETFMRVHKSFLVNTDKITMLEGNKLVIMNHIIPIGDKYKKETLNKFSKK